MFIHHAKLATQQINEYILIGLCEKEINMFKKYDDKLKITKTNKNDYNNNNSTISKISEYVIIIR